MMKKFLIGLMAIMLLLPLLVACGGKDDEPAPEAEPQTISGDVVMAKLPSGWCLVTGTEMTGLDTSDFICHSQEYKLGDSYLQVERDSRDIETIRAVLESEDPFGTYTGAIELGGVTWYIAANAAAGQIGATVCWVRGYQCDFSSADVQAILSSLQWVE